jgi:hypothetical protein
MVATAIPWEGRQDRDGIDGMFRRIGQALALLEAGLPL